MQVMTPRAGEPEHQLLRRCAALVNLWQRLALKPMWFKLYALPDGVDERQAVAYLLGEYGFAWELWRGPAELLVGE